MHAVAVCGKGREITNDELMPYTAVFVLGTSPLAETYMSYEFHGMNRESLDWFSTEHLLEKYPNMPFANSICIMMAEAIQCIQMCDDARIDILAAPMISNKEYFKERYAVAMWVGYARGLGIEVNWEGVENPPPYMYKEWKEWQDGC